jgi:hypothetical protein
MSSHKGRPLGSRWSRTSPAVDNTPSPDPGDHGGIDQKVPSPVAHGYLSQGKDQDEGPLTADDPKPSQAEMTCRGSVEKTTPPVDSHVEPSTQGSPKDRSTKKGSGYAITSRGTSAPVPQHPLMDSSSLRSGLSKPAITNDPVYKTRHQNHPHHAPEHMSDLSALGEAIAPRKLIIPSAKRTRIGNAVVSATGGPAHDVSRRNSNALGGPTRPSRPSRRRPQSAPNDDVAVKETVPSNQPSGTLQSELSTARSSRKRPHESPSSDALARRARRNARRVLAATFSGPESQGSIDISQLHRPIKGSAEDSDGTVFGNAESIHKKFGEP